MSMRMSMRMSKVSKYRGREREIKDELMEMIEEEEEAEGIQDFISLAENVAASDKSCPRWNFDF